MSYFKFLCPHCETRIEAGTDNVGLQINCPHCDGPVLIPEPLAAPAAPPESAAPAAASESPPVPEPAAERPTPGVRAKAPPKDPQVLALSTEIKSEMVRDVRELIGDGSRWISGIGADGKHVMAAFVVDQDVMPLKPDNAQATHFSIVGAFLREMNRRNVTITAAGRSRLLNEEIPDAARRAVAAARAAGETDLPAVADPMRLNHRMCLALLDQLAESYTEMFQRRLVVEHVAGRSKDMLVEMVANKDKLIETGELAEAVLVTMRRLEDRLQAAEGRIDALKKELAALTGR